VLAQFDTSVQAAYSASGVAVERRDTSTVGMAATIADTKVGAYRTGADPAV